MLKSLFAATGVLLLAPIIPANADIQLAPIFTNDMVLQRDRKAPIWGAADAGEQVVVSFEKQKKTATADENGQWRVELDPLAANTGATLTVEGKNKVELTNVAVGEVWVCSGQSNMEWPLAAANNAKEEIAAADYPQIRLFTVGKKTSEAPLRDLKGDWKVCTPQSVRNFSAVGYFFGRELNKTLDVPVGLINSSWGGTPAEAWTSRPALEGDAAFMPYLQRWDKTVADYPTAREEYEKQLAQWKLDAEAAKAEGKPAPRQPGAPTGPDHPHRPATLFNGMIAPLIPFSIRGAIWYQGESNAGRADNYRVLFPTMIRDWREKWGEGDFPFYFVQLANFMARKDEPGESAWAELRDAQRQTLALPNTGMAVIIDVGEAKDIHPRDKQTVGFRLAQAALAGTYAKKVAASGPVFDSMKIEDGKVRLKFKNVDGGLKIKEAALESKTPNSNEYPDVPGGHWAYAALEKLTKPGIVPPYESEVGKIKSMTRNEFAVVIARVMQIMPKAPPVTEKGLDPVNREIWNAFIALKWEFCPELKNLEVRLGSLESRVKPLEPVMNNQVCDDLQGFAIAGEDRKWVWADARIDGDSVIVSSEAVPNPVAVRYGWADNPAANLYNGAGLPASPFRTDDWPGVTTGK